MAVKTSRDFSSYQFSFSEPNRFKMLDFLVQTQRQIAALEEQKLQLLKRKNIGIEQTSPTSRARLSEVSRLTQSIEEGSFIFAI
jgi:hypothetical protein